MIPFLQRKWRWIAAFFFAAVVFVLGVSWLIGGALCAPKNCSTPLPKDLAVEPVTFASESGSNLHGWLVVSAGDRGVVILQHGIRGNKSSLVERAKFLSRAGYSVLLYDFQAHGESIGGAITLGYLESRDARAAVAFIKKRFPDRPIGVIGTSLGAAAAVLADPPLDVQALVLESMFPTVVEGTKDRIQIRLGRLGRCLSPLLTAQLKFRVGCTAEDLCPIDHVAKISAPKLFLAGSADRETKLVEAQKIFDLAAEPKSFVAFAGARHQDLLRFDTEKYQNLILNFLETNLK